ncbi:MULTISPECIES: hypothetical protein [unclassified Actinomyces]|uniref:hypothetical protein n=1 Tax=unclassified Actinomyces TaxID=2609248 RepID=UPI000D598455|nr:MULTISPECIES: hypothetical protein [unclassified Actinomyces]RAX24208.1 hypothetical protein DRB07_01970 [Actinomyces sp. Z3]
MTLLVHIVGEGDLGSDILRLEGEQRQQARCAGVTTLQNAAAGGAGCEAVDLLLRGAVAEELESRFVWTPLALELGAIQDDGHEGQVRVLLLGSSSGYGATADIAKALASLLERDEIRAALHKRYGLEVIAELHADGDLNEQVGRGDLSSWVEAAHGTAADSPVVVSMIGGATMMCLSAMGVVDHLGYDWRLAVAGSPDDAEARLIRRGHHGNAPFYWLRALGYLEQAAQWARQNGREELIDEEHTRLLRDLQAVLGGAGQERGEALAAATDEHLASLVAVEMTRADNGAGLAVRAWVEKHYEALLAEENAGRAQDDQISSVFKRLPGKELGKVLGLVRDEQLDQGSTSAAWLLTTGDRLRPVGNRAVHDAAAPTASDLATVNQVPELGERVPSWMHWPGRGRVLYICGMGDNYQRSSVIERVMDAGPDEEFRRAVPGGMLEGGGVGDVDFLLLHSASPGSKETAVKTCASALLAKRPGDLYAPGVDIIDYGGAESNDFAPVDDLAGEVSVMLREVLRTKQPSAVAIVASGQKSVAIGALEAAQAWCAEHAVPLFVQTSVQPGQNIKRSGMQFHRIALHNDAEAALREAAAASLSSLNLLSAVRVLSAGDQDMDVWAQACDELRKEYLAAVNAKDPDAHAGVLLSVMDTVHELCLETEGDVDPRLVVVVAEAVDFLRRGKKAAETLFRERYAWQDVKAYSAQRHGVEACSRGALLRLLYEVRNEVRLTHGDSQVDEAVREVMRNRFVDVDDDFGYVDLLGCAIKSVKAGPKRLTTGLDESWAERFRALRHWAEERA